MRGGSKEIYNNRSDCKTNEGKRSESNLKREKHIDLSLLLLYTLPMTFTLLITCEIVTLHAYCASVRLHL